MNKPTGMAELVQGLPVITGQREFQWPGETLLDIYWKFEMEHSRDIISLKSVYPLNSMIALEAAIRSAEKVIADCLQTRLTRINEKKPILLNHALWVIKATRGYTVRQVAEMAKIPHTRAQRLLCGEAKLCSSDVDNIVEGFRVPEPPPELRAQWEREVVIYEHAKAFNVHKGAVNRERNKKHKR